LLGAKLDLKENSKSNNCYFGAIKKVKFPMFFSLQSPCNKGQYLLYIKGCCEALAVGIYPRGAQRLCKSLVKQRVHSNERMHPMSVLLMF